MKTIIKNTLVFALVFVLSLAVLELYLRTTEISLPSIVRYHPKMGRSFKPNAGVMILNEGMYMGNINAYGYTGPGYPPEREPKTLRIALMGDSYVQGHYMADRYYFGNVMASKLEDTLRRRAQFARQLRSYERGYPFPGLLKVEALNMGIAGIDLRRVYIRFLEQARAYKPDITLFVIGPGDLLSMDRNLGGRCHLDEHKQLKIDYSFSTTRSYKRSVQLEFIRLFGFYPLFQKSYALYRRGGTADVMLGKLNFFAPAEENDGQTQEREVTKAEDRFFPVNRAIFQALADIDKSGETRVVIVMKKTFPSYYMELIEQMGLEVIDLTPILDDMRSKGFDPHYWIGTNKSGHWNHEAQIKIGNYLAVYFAHKGRGDGNGFQMPPVL